MPLTEPDDQTIRNLLAKHKSFAIVGASHKTNRPSYIIMNYLLGKGFDCTPVNPGLTGKEVLGRTVYASLEDIPHPIDVVDIFRISDVALEVTEQAIAIEAKAVWMQLRVINHEAARLASDAGLTVIMNRCPKIEYDRLFPEQTA